MSLGKEIKVKFVNPKNLYDSIEDFNKENEGEPVAILVVADSNENKSKSVLALAAERFIGNHSEYIMIVGRVGNGASIHARQIHHLGTALVDSVPLLIKEEVKNPLLIINFKRLFEESELVSKLKVSTDFRNKFTDSDKTIKKMTKIRQNFNSDIPKKFIKRGGKVHAI
ncbi:MAG: hypothetical protein NTW62_03740 [Candidatus Nomurabacteria bacterium]|nr:hypothetical protein [Candidatus Nomurabacteria bacterium]